MPHHSDPYDIGVFGMYYDPGDMTAILQTEVMPTAAAIVRAPDAAQVFGDVVTQRALPFSGIYDGLITRRNSYRADATAEKSVGDILPVAATVCRLPQAATRRPEIESIFT